jgi:hypothetical protein
MICRRSCMTCGSPGHAAPVAQRAAVNGLLAQAYEAAMDMLKQTGYVADATAAIERARWAAQRSGDPFR